ncbi:MAG: hypothetical protein H7Z75_09025 [Ferruginibacter sp.]|nr:hypothetical protein [Cytophagales bacterium]
MPWLPLMLALSTAFLVFMTARVRLNAFFALPIAAIGAGMAAAFAGH